MSEYTIKIMELIRSLNDPLYFGAYALYTRDNLVKGVVPQDDGTFIVHTVETVEYTDNGRKEIAYGYERSYRVHGEDEFIILLIA